MIAAGNDYSLEGVEAVAQAIERTAHTNVTFVKLRNLLCHVSCFVALTVIFSAHHATRGNVKERIDKRCARNAAANKIVAIAHGLLPLQMPAYMMLEIARWLDVQALDDAVLVKYFQKCNDNYNKVLKKKIKNK